MSRKRGLRMESLPHDVVELILEGLAVKSLLRFKAVSKQWKSTIESASFSEKQLKKRQESGGDPDVLMVTVFKYPRKIESLRTLVLGSSSSVGIPTPWEKENTHYLVSGNSCDGLVCLYHPLRSGYVVNPATRWYRPLPPCQFQLRMSEYGEERFFEDSYPIYKLGFGKDIVTGTYKAVFLYNNRNNSAEEEARRCDVFAFTTIPSEEGTSCEVFDFSTNSWRYVTPGAPYPIVGVADPVFVGGSLHWFTACWDGTKLVSLDLHTEDFQVLAKAPFGRVHWDDYAIVMCNLDNRLCVSDMNVFNQVIWSFDSGNKTWDKMFSIDLERTRALYASPSSTAFCPLTLLDGKKKKKNLLFYDPVKRDSLLTHDPETESDHVAFSAFSIGFAVCYFQSLISIS